MSNTWRRLYVHLVWGTKYRLPLIDAPREELIVRVFHQEALRAHSELLAFGAEERHLHALLSLHTTVNVASLVRTVKHQTTSEIERTDPRDPPFAWQSGYAVLSVDPRETAALRRYIQHQKEHHAEGTTRPEWEPPLDLLDDPSFNRGALAKRGRSDEKPGPDAPLRSLRPPTPR